MKTILSKEIKKYERYTNILNTYQLDIINGKWLFSMLIPEITQYIEIKKITYDNDKELVKKLLFLLNVDSTFSIPDKSYRFPFDEYKKTTWSIEHIYAQNSENILVVGGGAFLMMGITFFALYIQRKNLGGDLFLLTMMGLILFLTGYFINPIAGRLFNSFAPFLIILLVSKPTKINLSNGPPSF